MAELYQNHSLDAAEIQRRMVRYYAQSGEDCFIWTLLDFPTDGVFIDVGAFDGKYLSNSYSFAENGWRVVCVEPLQQYAAMCRANQPRSTCINAACVDSDAVSSVRFASEPLGIYSRLEVKSGDLEHLQDFYSKREEQLVDFDYIEVPAITVSAIAAQHLFGIQVDVLSVDVEGSEIMVLEGAGLEQLKPRLICAEANTDEAQAALDHYLAGFGYVFLRKMGVNSFYSAEPALIAKAAEIMIRCSIERQTHPLGARYSIPGILSGQIVDEVSQHARRKLQNDLQETAQQLRFTRNRLENETSARKEAERNLLASEALVRKQQGALRAATQTVRLERTAHESFITEHWHLHAPRWLPSALRPGPAVRNVSEPEHSLRKLETQLRNPHFLPQLGKTRLCLGGFTGSHLDRMVDELVSRSAMLREPNRIAKHGRSISLIEVCLRLGIPAFILITPPQQVAAEGRQPVEECLEQWLRFHQKLLPWLDMVHVLRTEDLASQPTASAKAILARMRELQSIESDVLLTDMNQSLTTPALPQTGAPGTRAEAVYQALVSSPTLLQIRPESPSASI